MKRAEVTFLRVGFFPLGLCFHQHVHDTESATWRPAQLSLNESPQASFLNFSNLVFIIPKIKARGTEFHLLQSGNDIKYL